MKIQRFKGTFLRFRRTKGVNFRENSARCGTVFACRALVTIDFGSMGMIVTALKMNPENHSNVTLLGLYLRRKGFERGDGRQRRCYKIATNGK